MEDKKIVTETDMMRAESVSGGTSSPCDENISGKSANGSQLIVGVNEKISCGKAAFLGMQHVLSMDLYIMPVILGAAIGLVGGELSFFLQMSFFACGIATILQAGFFMKYPIIQGPSYVPLGALCTIGATMGVSAMIGSLIPGAIMIILLGIFKGFSKFVKKAIPPFIGGIIILIVGISLTPTAAKGIASSDGNLSANVASGLTAAGVLIVCMILQYKLKHNRILHMVSVILALVAGTVVAAALGAADFSSVHDAAWFKLPEFFHFGLPKFEIKSCILMMFIYLIVLLDTTGTWVTISAITGEDLSDKRIDRATIGEGVGCLVGSLFGGTPMTGYSSNAGVLAITKVGSRMAIIAGGMILMVLGVCPKLMTIISCIPTPVVNGVFAVVCILLISNGIKIIQSEPLDERSSLIVGISVVAAVATIVIPSDVMNAMPQFLNYFMSSGTAVGATIAVVLQLCLPRKKKTMKVALEG